MVAGEEKKKSAKFWAPHPSGPHLSRLDKCEFFYALFLLFCILCEEGQNTETLKLAKVGQLRLAKVGLSPPPGTITVSSEAGVGSLSDWRAWNDGDPAAKSATGSDVR